MSNQHATTTDIKTVRRQARRNIDDGAITSGYQADRDALVGQLNEALATELVCVLRYRSNYFMATGLNGQNAADEFLEHAREELDHADAIAARIVQLGGVPNFSPDGLSESSHAEFVETDCLTTMIKENLVAERIAIDSYRQMIQSIGDTDPTTRRILEDILAAEEKHADEMAGLLVNQETE